MKLASRRSTALRVAVCVIGGIITLALGQKYRVVVEWGYVPAGGDAVTLGFHPATVVAMWACFVAAAMVLVHAVARSWGPVARRRVCVGACLGFAAGLVAGTVLWRLAQPVGYGGGGWTDSELSYRLSIMIGPLAPGLDLWFLGIGMRELTVFGPALAWAIYGSVLGLTRHAWTLHQESSSEAAA